MNLKELAIEQEKLKSVNLKKANLLALLLNFEKYWQNYSLSDGFLYAKEVRNEAKKIVPLFYEVYGKKAIVNPDNTVNDVDLFESRRFIDGLEKWLEGEDKFPKVLFGREYTNRTSFVFQVILIELESQLEKDLNLPVKLSYSATVQEYYFQRKQLTWAGQIPERLIETAMEPSFVTKLSGTETLVVVADIRRSQDLITYGLSPKIYREQIMGFLTEVKKILHENYGIFDRFTGDGFVAYFNEFACGLGKRDYYEMTLDACHKIQSFSAGYFDKWSGLIRKIPIEPIGLSIGVDCGSIDFKDFDGQLFAIGEACVWATRMCNAGKKGDIVFNNIPFHRICSYGTEGFSEEIDATTKNGETFKAFRINPTLVSYKKQPQKDPSLDSPAAIS